MNILLAFLSLQKISSPWLVMETDGADKMTALEKLFEVRIVKTKMKTKTKNKTNVQKKKPHTLELAPNPTELALLPGARRTFDKL